MPEPAPKPPTVLVVEDEEDLADLYTTWLVEGYDVKTVYTGQSALDTLDGSIDFVLLDRRLPDVSGDEVLEQIEDKYPDLPVAIISAITPGFGIMETGIEDYLVKPIDKPELLELVAEMLDRRDRPAPNQELARLRAKKNSLEAAFSSSELQRREEYQALEDRIRELETVSD